MIQLTDNTLILRKPAQGDLEQRLSYGNNPEILRMFGHDSTTLPPSHSEVKEWLASITNAPYSWIVEYENRLVGEAKLHSLNMDDKRARYAIGLYDPSKLGIGLGKNVTQLILEYAFNELHLHRVDLRVLTYNMRAIKCYQKCGFIIEGRERESALVDGEWHDDLIMAILAKDFQTIAR